ncbi:LANO_0B01442g1_1 [Lachancea nothofagi CBS 11611]|uniref:LANO_0B01442g1_1 n=1 Tax=Lachancea nothofagi CBS 11611 TaxID=1266666 RepID=A0A1G4IVI9_9SACH|nr:LANO_0B01442g1_1 [Lachancea nothofagi CBS 11611]
MSQFFKSATIDSATDCDIEVPQFVHFPATQPPQSLQEWINHFGLEKHAENGYFKETDRSPFEFECGKDSGEGQDDDEKNSVMPTDSQQPEYKSNRNFSTLIYYMLTPDAPVSKMIMNTSRNIHILQRGKGQFVLVYPDGKIKSFKVGFDYASGEVSQWVVPGGVWKASFLIPNEEFDNGFLISEVVVPGFEYTDYKPFPGFEALVELVGPEKAEQLKLLL